MCIIFYNLPHSLSVVLAFSPFPNTPPCSSLLAHIQVQEKRAGIRVLCFCKIACCCVREHPLHALLFIYLTELAYSSPWWTGTARVFISGGIFNICVHSWKASQVFLFCVQLLTCFSFITFRGPDW